MRAKPLLCDVGIGAELGFLHLPFVVYAVQPGAVAAGQSALTAQNFPLHKFRPEGVFALSLRHPGPGIGIAAHLQGFYKEDSRPLLGHVGAVGLVLLTAGGDDDFPGEPLMEFRPLRRLREFRLNVHQGPDDGVAAAPDLQIQRSLVVIQNGFADQLGALCGSLNLTPVSDIAHFGYGPKIVRCGITISVLHQIGVVFFIVIDHPEHPVRSGPAVGLVETAFMGIIGKIIDVGNPCLLGAGDTLPMEFGRGLHNALQLHLIAVEQEMPEGILVIHFRILGDDGSYLHSVFLLSSGC